MTLCRFCENAEISGWFASYCDDCAMLRRLLLVNEPQKCIDILKRVLLRTDQQITNKINQEIAKPQEADDRKDYDKPKTRSKQIPGFIA
tara:strand:- start:3496 stop:3762 length:267 start_codon:yes stop_codon:yes gene_type:complete